MVTDHWYFLLHTKKRKFEVIDPSSSPFFSREKLLTNHVIFFFYWTTFGVVRLLCQKSWHTFDETFIHIENKSYFNSWSKNFFYVGFIYLFFFFNFCKEVYKDLQNSIFGTNTTRTIFFPKNISRFIWIWNCFSPFKKVCVWIGPIRS